MGSFFIRFFFKLKLINIFLKKLLFWFKMLYIMFKGDKILKIIRILVKESCEADLLSFFKGMEIEILTNIPSIKGEKSIEILLQEQYVEHISYYLKKHFGPTRLKVFTQNIQVDFGKFEGSVNGDKLKKLLNNEETNTIFNRKSLQSIELNVKSGLSNVNYYYAMVVLSSIVAGAGLIGNSPAVIIGSMVIAPLLGPNVALAFSVSVGDILLFKKSIKHFFIGVAIAIVLGFLQGKLINFENLTHEILSRTNITFLDLTLAFCSGIAGVLSLVIGANGTLVGVMIAVALMPPLVTFGILLGRGDTIMALSAFLLFLANVIVINLAGILTFRLEKVAPRQYFQQQIAKKKGRLLIRIWLIILLIISVIIFLKK